jgi:hypothetical protein
LTKGSYPQVCSGNDVQGAGFISCIPIDANVIFLPQDGLIEDGTFQVVSQYFNLNNNSVNDTFLLASASTPEPATMLLFGSGLLMAASIARKRRRD